METGKRKRIGKILRLLCAFIVGIIVLWVIINSIRGIITSSTGEFVELDTEEKANYIFDVFHIKDTNNIGSCRVWFNHGLMTLFMDDIKDIHELCFENLAYYELTEADYDEIIIAEEEYNKMLNAPSDRYVSSCHKYAGGTFDGRWDNTDISTDNKIWTVEFKDKNDSCSIFISKSDDGLRCRIRTDWGELEDLKKLHSMD